MLSYPKVLDTKKTIFCIFSLYIASMKYISCTCKLKRRKNYYTGGSLCDREKSLSEQTLRLKNMV